MTRNFLRTNLTVAAILVLGALIAATAMLAWVPPVSRDALTHHLAIPKLYLKHGGMYEIPSIAFSYYPMNLDLLYLVSLYFGQDILPKLIHYGFALLTAWLICSYLSRRIDLLFGLVGALLFLSTPVILKLSVTAYVDLGLVFFSTAAVLLLMKWAENRFRMRYLVVAAVFCGLAIGTKYNGLLALFLLTAFVPLIYLRAPADRENEHPRNCSFPGRGPTTADRASSLRALLYATVFLVVALVVFSPWLIRNYVWTNNPIYPLFDGWFNAHRPTGATSLGVSVHFAGRKIVFGESWLEILLIPVRIFFEGRDDQPQHFDGVLNPFLLILPVFAMLSRRKESSAVRFEQWILAGYVGLFLLLAFLTTDMRIRYISPIIPPLVILSMQGVRALQDRVGDRLLPIDSERVPGAIVSMLMVAVLGINSLYLVEQFRLIAPLGYISGRIDREAYIEKFRPEYPAFKYANMHLPSDARIMCLFLGNRSYYSDRELIFGDRVFRSTVKAADSVQQLVAQLRSYGVTHFLIRYDIFIRWSESQFEPQQIAMVQEFLHGNLDLLMSQGGYGLYRLKG